MRTFEVEIEYGGKELKVKGSRAAYFPAVSTGNPDTWKPAEGGEFEDIRIYEMMSSGHLIPLSVKDEKELQRDSEFMEALMEAV